MYFNEDIEVSASKAADSAYNKVIVDGVIMSMYEQYGIELYTETRTGQGVQSQSRSEAELAKDLVNAIATEKAKPKLRGLNNE